ncbi:MAG: molybdenum cofactor guanylyltransferase [Acidobacteriia bacterium]|nr:molybdenum cofactor guanylyltransferase [Terriglobia bacterium]
MGQIIGVVLAGGRGTLMGRPRGSFVLDGLSLAERAARTLRPITGTVVVSISPGMANPAPKYAAVEDAAPAFRGPLAGIDAAMSVTGDSDLLVLSCGYPGVDTALLRTLLSEARPEDELVFLVDPNGRDHPLAGLWRRVTRDRVREAVEYRMHKVSSLLPDLVTRRLGPREMPDQDLGTALAIVAFPEDGVGWFG